MLSSNSATTLTFLPLGHQPDNGLRRRLTVRRQVYLALFDSHVPFIGDLLPCGPVGVPACDPCPVTSAGYFLDLGRTVRMASLNPTTDLWRKKGEPLCLSVAR